MLLKNSNLLTLINIASYSIKYSFLKTNLQRNFFQIKSTKVQTLLPTAQFNNIDLVRKLNSLGFSFSYLRYNQSNLLINSKVLSNKYDSNKTFQNLIIVININKCVSLRSIHTFMLLYFFCKYNTK